MPVQPSVLPSAMVLVLLSVLVSAMVLVLQSVHYRRLSRCSCRRWSWC